MSQKEFGNKPKLLHFEFLDDNKKVIFEQIQTLDGIIASLESGAETSVFSLTEIAKTVKMVAEDMERHCTKFKVFRKVANKVLQAASDKEKSLLKQ